MSDIESSEPVADTSVPDVPVPDTSAPEISSEPVAQPLAPTESPSESPTESPAEETVEETVETASANPVSDSASPTDSSIGQPSISSGVSNDNDAAPSNEPDPFDEPFVLEAGMELNLEDIDPDKLDLGEEQLKELDRTFLGEMNQKRENDECVESHEASHFWFYVLLLILLVCLVYWVVACIREGRTRRLQARLAGYA